MDADKVFTTVALFNITRINMTLFFPFAVQGEYLLSPLLSDPITFLLISHIPFWDFLFYFLHIYPSDVPGVAETQVALTRLEHYLLLENANSQALEGTVNFEIV